MRIAVASSGLSHVARGVEAWADDLGCALHRVGENVTLYQGSGNTHENWRVVLPCGKRSDPNVQRWVQRLRGLGGWRYGFGSGYEVEQTTFAFHLWQKIRKDFDILHVQDPWVAYWLNLLHDIGASRPRVILAHGTGEPSRSLRSYPVLQHLAPCYLHDCAASAKPSQMSFAIPNFVDTMRFCPGDRTSARKALGLPEHELIVLCVAAINTQHKRIDYLIKEFAAYLKRASAPSLLVVAGASEPGTESVIRMGRELLGDRVRFLENVPRQSMALVYQAADLFTLASLNEVFGIVVLEALASGLAVACHRTPVLEWIVGPAGSLTDISRAGALAEQLYYATRPERDLGRVARLQAVEHFSEGVVIPNILDMYQKVAQWSA